MRLIKTQNFTLAINEYGDINSDKLCILMPGRLDTKDYINFISHGNFISKLDYYVVSLDPPFTWDSPGSLDNYTTTTYVQSINELIEFFGNKKTILIGHSRGGATAMLASKNPCIEAIVLVNAAYGSPTPPDKNRLFNGKYKTSRDLPPGDKKTVDQKNFMLSMNYWNDGNKHNPIKALKQFKGFKLIIHANRDEFYDLYEIKQIYQKISEPKTFLQIDSDHDYRLFPKAIDDINKAIKKLINNL